MKRIVAAVLPLAALVFVAFAYAAEKGEDDEKKDNVPVTGLPEAVKKAATGFFGSLDGVTAEKEKDEDVTWYEVKGTKNGAKTEIKLTEAGDLAEIEQASSYEKLPAAAQRELKKDYPGAEFTRVEAVEAHYYEVQVKTKDGTKEVRVLASGDIEGGDDEDEDDKDK